ncbi:hypothetical protein C3747_70g147 [Trypanosoma cruzi]|uniref:Uncharacterized protein n=2 Tax=Trypanosoma cruzi TaxID=5693 RepID=Q4CT91_TRYCC|nr:hypothetical protein, conserved [Trypanosoma cruzi]EAN83493.1 hypothetical protein, conserved [Trypanosoma cruzi]PWV10319.1 hypothetical protein C3747_70g147 [Trypanosoma cruzi]RNC61144.1 hypothetical protein TcCL_ESM01155 [Trypanosoma cruzi]|eukprot:XP_805344.1 hypothetical protein [Trypanosoma cruzi strain CL Brener]
MTAMEPYSFATVLGDVFGRSVMHAEKRPYVPKGSRVHVSFTTATTTTQLQASQQLGIPRRVKKEREDDDKGDKKGETRREAEAVDDNLPVPVALTGLISTDPSDGKCLIRRTATDGDDGGALWESKVIPSGKRIGCIQIAPDSRAGMLQFLPHAAAFPSPLLYVADTVGNVYAATLPASSVTAVGVESPAKRPRQEKVNRSSFWGLIVPATTSDSETTHGAWGWCGIVPFFSQQLVCCREFFFDIRLVDVPAGTVVRQYGTIQPATGTTACPGIPHGVVVAEGPVATLYDMRCPGAALTLNTDTKPDISLVTSRLTSPTSYVAGVCSTCNEYEVAAAVGRSLCVYDVRKWSCVSVSTNILKYEIGSIAPFASGKAVVVAGIDAEVRIVPLQKASPVSAASAPTHAGGNGIARNEKVKKEEEGESAAPNSFRNRIDSAVCCRSTWNGGWVESLDGSNAIGVSADHEVFLSF